MSNPYQPPQAEVVDFVAAGHPDQFLEPPRRVPAGNGAGWYSKAWQLLMQNAGLWLVILVMFVLLVGSSWVLPPVVALILQYVLFPLPVAFLAGACDDTRRGEPGRTEELFARVRARAVPLLLLGVLYLSAIMVVAIVSLVPLLGWTGLNLLFGEAPPAIMQDQWQMLILAVLVMLALTVPVFAAMWFSPVLILLHGYSPLQAAGSSLLACLRNFWALVIYGLVGLVLVIAASLPFFLGWLLLLPVMMVTVYASYRDIYFNP